MIYNVYIIYAFVCGLMWFQHYVFLCLCLRMHYIFYAYMLLPFSWLHYRRPPVHVADRRPGADGRHCSATV